MQEDYGGYARRRKKPGKGRYPMGPTNIDRVDIGSCVWYPTFLVDTVSGRRLRVSTRMKMANQVKRSKIANCLKKNYGGYAGRLRRLCREITEVMQGDYGVYAGRRKKPGIGRYPMGPTIMH